MINNEGTSSEIELKEKIENLRIMNASLEKKQKEVEKEKIIKIVSEEINSLREDTIMMKLNYYVYLYEESKGEQGLLLDELFDFEALDIDDDILEICNKELYQKISPFLKQVIEKASGGKILEIISDIQYSEIILEKNKTRYLVNHGSLDGVTILSKGKLNELRKDLISFFDIVIKYELDLIEKKEFKDEAACIFFKILRIEEIKNKDQFSIYSKENIAHFSYSNENTEKIKLEVKEWIKGNEEVRKLKLKLILEGFDDEISECDYLYDETLLIVYKTRMLKEIEDEIKELEIKIIKESSNYNFFNKSIDFLSKRYEEVMAIETKI